MSDISFSLTLLASLWASLTTTFNASKQVNDLRDAIILGRKDSETLTLAHRNLMFKYNWSEMLLAIAAKSFVFAVLIALLPCLVRSPASVVMTWTFSLLVATVPLYTAVTTLRDHRTEGKFIRKLLEVSHTNEHG